MIGCRIVKLNVDIPVFNSWVEKVLITNLRYHSIVVIDNTAFYKSKESRRLLEYNKHEIEFLPPYFPDLNHIELIDI